MPSIGYTAALHWTNECHTVDRCRINGGTLNPYHAALAPFCLLSPQTSPRISKSEISVVKTVHKIKATHILNVTYKRLLDVCLKRLS